MGMIIRLGLMALMAAVLVGCGPIYETQYQFTPPKEGMGRQLVGQCRQTQHMCEQNCTLREQACRADARMRGMYDYQAYVERRRREKAEIKRTPDSFVQDWACSNNSCGDSCGGEYRECYRDAGGRVDATRVCVAFCDQR